MARRRRSQQPITQGQPMMQNQAYMQGQPMQENQEYMQGQSYMQNQASVQSPAYTQSQTYMQNQTQSPSYTQSQASVQRPTYTQSQSSVQSPSYTQSHVSMQNPAYSQSQSSVYGQDYTQSQAYIQSQPQNSSYTQNYMQNQTYMQNPAYNQTAAPSYGEQDYAVQSMQSYIPQARNDQYQYPAYQGGVPVAGSSGNMNAPYGSRNTGINHADARNVGFQGGYTGYGANGQPTQYGTFMRDGTQYGVGPHTIDPNKAMIQAVHYDDGAIAAVQFQDGRVVDIAGAIGMAESGLIEDVNTGRNREGEKTLRSYPDGDPSNNLSNLPRF